MADKSKMTPNKPVKSDRAGKKKMVLASEDGKQKLIHYGDTNYKHNYSKEAKKSFRARHKCDDQNDKLSAVYWACKDLWPKNKNNFCEGGMVDGPEIVKGDSEKNDIVKANLSPGEMVIPKTVVKKGPDAIKKFAEEELNRVNMAEGGLVAQDNWDEELPEDLVLDEQLPEDLVLDQPEVQPREKTPKFESAVRGGLESATLGFSDELIGALETPVTAVKEGKLSPSEILDVYRSARDRERELNRKAYEDNPVTYFGTGLASGLAMPLGALGNLKTATTAAKATQGAKVGAGLGAVAGAGLSEGDLTKGEALPVAEDVAKGTVLGGVLGAAIPTALDKAVIPAAKKTASLARKTARGIAKIIQPQTEKLRELLPEYLNKAYDLGRKGVDIDDPKTYEAAKDLMLADVDKIANEIAPTKEARELFKKEAENKLNEIIQKEQAKQRLIKKDIEKKFQEAQKLEKQQKVKALEEQAEATKGKIKGKEEELNKYLAENKNRIQKEIIDIEDTNRKRLQLEKETLLAKNKEDLARIEKEKLAVSNKLQDNVLKTEGNLNKEYEVIDKVIEENDVFINNENARGLFIEELSKDLSIPEATVKGIDDALGRIVKSGDFMSYQTLKRELGKYAKNSNPVIRRAASQARRLVNENALNSLKEQGFDEVSKKLADTNRRWGALKNIQDDFVATDRNPITGERYVSPTTLKTIRTMEKGSAEQVAKAQEFEDLLKILNPEESNVLLSEASDLAQRSRAASDFKPEVAKLDEVLTQDPEYVKRQQLLEDFKLKRFQDETTQRLAQEVDVEKQGLDNLFKQMEEIKNLPGMSVVEKNEILLRDPKYAKSVEILDNLRNKGNLDKVIATVRELYGDQTANVLKNIKESDKLLDNRQVQKDLLAFTPKLEQRSGNLFAEKMLQDYRDLYSKAVGPETAKKEFTQLGEKADILNITRKPSTTFGSFVTTIKPTTWANKLGLANRKLLDDPAQATKALSEVDSATLNQLADELAKRNTNAKYVEDLKAASNKTGTGKNAVIFSLMQQKQFREALRQVAGEEDNGEE